MPHQCTSCDKLLENGSREMLGGCPACGGNRFRYYATAADATNEHGHQRPRDEDKAKTGDQELIVASEEPPENGFSLGGEDSAQSDARRELVTPDDLPPAPQQPDADDSPQAESGTGEPPEELRTELEETFGSIKIVDRGAYELNLMELYERDACIIELGEDGRYVIDVPEMMGED